KFMENLVPKLWTGFFLSAPRAVSYAKSSIDEVQIQVNSKCPVIQ
ncbi:24715_t:CDS:1, partial [Gigaspora margarita]